MITLKEIASRCSVSIATVSNILNGKSNVSEDTKQRVLQVIKETGYKPNYMARGLRASKTQTVGLLIDDFLEFSCPGITDGIMSYLEENNYKAIIVNLRFYSKWESNGDIDDAYYAAVDAAIQEFLTIKVDGIIYVAGHARDINNVPADLPIPLVISFAFSNSQSFSSVMFDDFKGAYTMIEHLIKNGHKKIAAIFGKKGNIHTIRRIEGLKQALKDNNLTFDESLTYYGDWTIDSGYSSCKNLLESGKEFSALFCFNDSMAAGAYAALHEKNLIPGKDISVAGFDNRVDSIVLNPQLTTIEIPLYDIGRKSAELILNQINSEEDFQKQEILLDCRFIQRKSIKQI